MMRFSHNAQRYLSSDAIACQPVNAISIGREPQQFGSASNGAVSGEKLVDIPAKQYNLNETFKGFLTRANSIARPMKYALCTALNACTKTFNWHLGLQFHAQIIVNGYKDNVILSSALVDFYSKCNQIEDAKSIFNYMKQHDQVSWTSIISGYAQLGCGDEAFLLFKNMLKSDIKHNCFTYVSIITARSGLYEALDLGLAVHAHVLRLGFATNSFLLSSLIDFYSKCGRVDGAALLFDAATTRDNILYNSMIAGYCQNFYCEDALKLLIQMREEGVSPTNFTMSSVFKACGSLSLLCLGSQVHCLVIKQGLFSNVLCSY